MKKNGFTLVELITTFALTATIIILLLNVVVVIKNLYTNTNIKTELYINQSNLSNVLNSKIKNDNLKSIQDCTEVGYLLCQIFEFDGENKKLLVSEKSVNFGEYIYKLEDNTIVQNPSLNIEYLSNGDSVAILKIPIINEIYPDMDFGINLVHVYNPSEIDLQ